ncbi:TRXX1 [Auxenochlorella protothecoides x Auxenochlorella symbiontica]
MAQALTSPRIQRTSPGYGVFKGCWRAPPQPAFRHARNPRGVVRSRAQPTKAVIDVSESTFEAEVLKSEIPVLIDFWATWCGPCKLVAPFVDWVAEEYKGTLKVVKIETDPNPGIVEKYKVYGLPCLLLFADGKEVPGSRHEGGITKQGLVKYLDKNNVAAKPA